MRHFHITTVERGELDKVALGDGDNIRGHMELAVGDYVFEFEDSPRAVVEHLKHVVRMAEVALDERTARNGRAMSHG